MLTSIAPLGRGCAVVALLVLGLATAPAAHATLCARKKGGRVFSREQCKKKEVEVPVDQFLQTGERGAKGDPGDKGDAGAYHVVDSAGREVGIVYTAIGADTGATVIVQTPVGPMLLRVGPEGFLENPPFFQFEAIACQGPRFLRDEVESFFRQATVSGGLVHYAADPIGDHAIQSSGDITACSPVQPASTRRVGPAASFPVSDLGFTPPFHIPLP